MGIETAGAEAAPDAAIGQPVQGRRGRPPKRPSGTAISSVFESDAGQRLVADVDPLEAAAGPTPVEDNAVIAEMTDPVSASEDSGGAAALVRSAAAPRKPAAQWDRATDTVLFDWAEIERTALQDGPNQPMAKLLVAARAEGANSRWPF